MDKTFSIKTLGCKLNQYESNLIAGQFLARGWKSIPFGKEKADVVIINTCTVTDRSDKKCRNYIRQGAGFSKSGRVIVAGCLVERDAKGTGNMPEVEKIFLNSEKDDIISYIERREGEFSAHNAPAGEYPACGPGLLAASGQTRTRGTVKVQDGCDGVCSYCIVPSVRGKPVSRDFSEAVCHAEVLIDDGCPEIVLTGITIGKYSDRDRDLADLAAAIADLPGRFRLRLSSIEPNHITEKIIDLLGHEKVCGHLHVPLQSGSDRVLGSMRRRYKSGEYIRIIENIKTRFPETAIGTDIIIGYPGEEEADFNESLKIIERAGFSYVHQFTYSSRSGTEASRMPQNLSPGVVKGRSGRMRELALKTGLKYRGRFLERTLQSVIEKNKNTGGFSALSDNYIRIALDDSPLNMEKNGKIAGVKLTACLPGLISGIIVEN